MDAQNKWNGAGKLMKQVEIDRVSSQAGVTFWEQL
jgi:hypothetical protein